MSDVDVIGLQELQRDLKRVAGKLQGRVVRNATRAGATMIRRRAKEMVPHRTGQLRKGIIIRTGRGRDRNEMVASVGLKNAKRSSGGAFYGIFHEFGTRFMPARPFLRPAFDATKDQAAKEVIDRAWREIRRFLK